MTLLRTIMQPVFEEIDRNSKGLLEDFQVSDSYHVELTLTVGELRKIKIALVDPLLRAKMAIREDNWLTGKDEGGAE